MTPEDVQHSIANAGEWTCLNLSPHILDVLTRMSFTQMTPVQKSSIPLFLSHKDVVVEAMTGSGKTLAFVIPLLEIVFKTIGGRMEANTSGNGEHVLLKKNELLGLVICPTRELAKQIHVVLNPFLEATNSALHTKGGSAQMVSSALFVGGNDVSADISTIHTTGANLIIGTPGRIEDLLSRQILFTKECEMFIMDEADRLLDMGFEKALNAIIRHLPKQRRTGLFSATMSEAFSELVRTGLRNPVKIVVKVQDKSGTAGDLEQRTPSSLKVHYLFCHPRDKLAHLVNIIRRGGFSSSKIIVYFSTCASVEYFSKIFRHLKSTKGWQLSTLHGKMAQKKRDTVYTTFSEATPSDTGASPAVLFCTDVAARGLDFPDVDLVIQFDPPTDPKSFAHRCGRSGRLGRQGTAIVFLSHHEETYIHFLQLRNVPMEPFTLPTSETFDTSKNVNPPPLLTPSSLETQIHTIAMKDRDIIDSSLRAFVSFIRSYQAHQAHLIFRFKEVDILGYVRMFGLLKWPHMPELKGIEVAWDPPNDLKKRQSLLVKYKLHIQCGTEFEETETWKPVDIKQVVYKDKQREKKRLQELAQKAADTDHAGREGERKSHSVAVSDVFKSSSIPKATGGSTSSQNQKSSSWSSHKLQKEKRQSRQLKRQRKKLAILEANLKKHDSPGCEMEDIGLSLDDEIEDDYKQLVREKKKQKK